MTIDQLNEAFVVLISKINTNAHYNGCLDDAMHLRDEMRLLVAERDMWKRRAAQHGCNIEEGDHECA